jgi:hypothetical protein
MIQSNSSSEDMKELFEFPLRRMYELLLEQLQQARRAGKVQIKVREACESHCPKSDHLVLTVIVCLHGWRFLRVPIHVREDQDICGG